MEQSLLLDRIDRELGGSHTWSDVIVVRNVGPLTTVTPLVGDIISNRGFNAIVCAPGGAPTHFLKVRPTAHENFQREAETTVRLTKLPGARPLMPCARMFVAGPARVLAEEFVEGVALDVVIRARSTRWYEIATRVLRATAPLLAAVREFHTEDPRVVSDEALLEDLALLRSLGLGETVADSLARRLRSLSLPPRPQHGDFWPRNVLQVDGGWRVLDFENCGEVVLPLYDVFHFVRGCGEAARGDTAGWLERWRAAGPRARPLAEEVRRAAGELDIPSIEVALVAYMVEFAARLHRRGIARDRTARRLRELDVLPSQLDDGIVQRLLG